jgi:hypothetical protein
MMAKIIPEKNTNNDAKAIKISQPATTDQGAQPLPETAVTASNATPTSHHDDVEHPKQLNCAASIPVENVKEDRKQEDAFNDLPFPEVEPHTSPADPALLLNEIAAAIRLFIVMEPEQVDAAVVWVAQTWFIDYVEAAPLAIINAPEKACGKSQLLDVMGRMSARPLPVANVTQRLCFGRWNFGVQLC